MNGRDFFKDNFKLGLTSLMAVYFHSHSMGVSRSGRSAWRTGQDKAVFSSMARRGWLLSLIHISEPRDCS